MSVLSRLGMLIGRGLAAFGLGTTAGPVPDPEPPTGTASLPTHVVLLSPARRRVRRLSPAHRKVRLLG